MSVESEVKMLLTNFSKRDIATALVRSRVNNRRDRKKVLELENQIHEIIDALGILRENATHQDVMNHIYRMTGVLTDTTDIVESVVKNMDV